MRFGLALTVLLCFAISGKAHGHDMVPFTEEILTQTLKWREGNFKAFDSLPEILKNFKGRRDPLKDYQILSPEGWRFLGAYFDTPQLVGSATVQMNILLNQTHLTHRNSVFLIERRTQVLKLELSLQPVTSPKAMLHACRDLSSFAFIRFARPMTEDQLKDFIPNPILALGRLLSIGYGNIKKDPFAHFEQLMGLFNKVEGVNTKFTPQETQMVKAYADQYKIFEEGFAQGSRFNNPCDRLNGEFVSVQSSQVLIF